MSESDTSDSVSEDLQPISIRKRRSTASTPGARRTSTRKSVAPKAETPRTPRVYMYNVSNEPQSTPLTTQMNQASAKPQMENPKPVAEAPEEIRKPEPIVEEPIKLQSPVKEIVKEVTQQIPEPILRQPEVIAPSIKRPVGAVSYLHYYLRYLTWSSFMAAFGVASLIIFVDIHLLSKSSKRRTSFVNVVLSILLISFLSMIARDNITPVPAIGQTGTYVPQGPIVISQTEIDKILKQVDKKFNPRFETFDQNLSDFKKTLNEYQDSHSKIKTQLKSLETLVSAGADPSKVDVSQYLTQLRDLEQRLESMIDSQIQAVQKKNLELANRQNQFESKFDKEKQDFDTKIQELLSGVTQSSTSVSNVEASLKNEIDKILEQLTAKQVPEEVVKQWANDVFNSEKTKLTSDLLKSVQTLMDDKISNILDNNSVEPKTLKTAKVEVLQIIESKLEQFLADKIGRPDFALASAGARIMQGSTSPSYSATSWWPLSFLGARQSASAPASVVIQQDNSIGNCYALAGQEGHITIQLALPIIPVAFTLDHISSEIAFNSTSTPKDFRVIGYRNASDPTPITFGPFTYRLGKDAKQIQTFEIPSDQQITETISFVTLDVKSNYGNTDYTCVYRFRVHGNPQS